MLGPRLCALGARRRVRPVLSRGLTPHVRSYLPGGEGQAGEVWDKKADAQLNNALKSTSGRNGKQGRIKGRMSDKDRRCQTTGRPFGVSNPRSSPHRDDADTSGFGLLQTVQERPQETKSEPPSETVVQRAKKAKTIAAQHDNFLKVHGKSIAYLERSPEKRSQETATTYRKSLASMNEHLDDVMESLRKDMPEDEYEKLASDMGRDRAAREGRAARWDDENPERLTNRQSKFRDVALNKDATLRPVNVAARRLDAVRKWALMARRQAERAATLAQLDGAPQEAKDAAELLSSAAALATKDFKDLRERYKHRLSAAELRDIEVTEERGGSSFSSKEVDEAVATMESRYFKRDGRFESEIEGDLSATDFPVKPIKAQREGKVARLANNLQRVLFSPGVHYVRDPRTGVWNFPQELTQIPTPEEFNFDTLPDYVTASKDPELADLAQADGIKYSGSTSTLTGAFSQVWLTLNGGQGVDISKLTQEYATQGTDYTAGAQLPAAIAVWPQPSGRYAVDSDKRFQTDANILSEYGNILEKILTTDASEWWKSLKNVPEGFTPPEKPTAREAYAYSRGGKILMRSQLDCQDNRLPGSGTFDIKTRAAMPIRHDRANWEAHKVYDISETLGEFASFERETFDLTRSGMLKYCFQARIGDMDGIFIAYHNTARCFGFEYMPRTELDQRLFGGPDIGDQVFALCIGFFERIMDLATGFFPDQALSLIWFQAQPPMNAFQKARMGSRQANELIVAVQPSEWTGEGPVPTRTIRIQMLHNVDGKDVPPSKGIRFFASEKEARAKQKWTVRYNIAITPDNAEGHENARGLRAQAVQRLMAMNSITVPEGMTPADMYSDRKGVPSADAEVAKGPVDDTHGPAPTPETEDPTASSGYDELSYATIKWVEPNARVRRLRKASYETGRAYEERAAKWNAQVRQMKATDPEPEIKPEPYVIPEHMFQPTQWRERKPDAPGSAPAVDKEVEEFAETACSSEAEGDAEVDLDASEESAWKETAKEGPTNLKRDLPPHI